MNHDTAALIRALGSVNQHLPRMVNDVLLGQMPTNKQHEFADLLIELGELLHRHADADEAPDAAPGGDSAARDSSPLDTNPPLTNSEEQQR